MPFINACGGFGQFKNYEIGALAELADALWQLNLINKFIALYPFVGGTANMHSFNFINPNIYKISWSGQQIHNKNGVTGVTGYGKTNIPISLFASLENVHISAYNRTPFSQINKDGRFIGVNTKEFVQALSGVAAFELNFSKNDGIIGYVYNIINTLGGFGYTINQMTNLNINGTGLMVGVNTSKCYLNGQVFGNWFPLLPTDIDIKNNLSLILFGNNYENKITSTLNANISLASVGRAFSENDIYNYNMAVDNFQKAMFRSVM
jgi:hypothetical protein